MKGLRLADTGDDYARELVNKKRASPEQLVRLKQEGYRVPSHWRDPTREKPFIGWDGEGITYPSRETRWPAQSFALFGASTGDRISKPELSTVECLDLMLAVERTNPDAIHVGFAFQYDVNMILRDLSRRHLENVYHRNSTFWNGYRIEYRPGKWLSIRKHDVRMRLFDVWGFFQSSFVVACERFLGKDDPELARIREGKAARSSFVYDELEAYIVPYWEAELRLLVRLMDSLREDLEHAGLPIKSWHGPGAVANTVFRQRGIKEAKGDTPPVVNRAAQYAYAGGRFELFRCGHYPATVYEYDINSAYPYAIAQLPDLSTGVWEHVFEFEQESFAVWRIDYDTPGLANLFVDPQPLFVRDRHGAVSFPPIAQGWYWTPEARLVPPRFVKEGWVYRHDGRKPFEFIHEMYETRKQWKAQGISAEKALKLAMNSLYGKMAQRVGWVPDETPSPEAVLPNGKRPGRLPTWHQLEWAGFVTSIARAKLWDALSLAPGSVIAVETDALFSTVPLPLEVGSELGQWEATEFDWITYFQNGVYYGGQGSDTVEKYRGFDKGSLPHEAVMAHLRSIDNGTVEAPLTGRTTRFVGFGSALHTRARWRSWRTDEREVSLGGGGKRSHVRRLCRECKAGIGLAEGLHSLQVVTAGGRSFPHALPWMDEEDSELRLQDELTRW